MQGLPQSEGHAYLGQSGSALEAQTQGYSQLVPVSVDTQQRDSVPVVPANQPVQTETYPPYSL